MGLLHTGLQDDGELDRGWMGVGASDYGQLRCVALDPSLGESSTTLTLKLIASALRSAVQGS